MLFRGAITQACSAPGSPESEPSRADWDNSRVAGSPQLCRLDRQRYNVRPSLRSHSAARGVWGKPGRVR
jgi:hypothetical protein